MKHLLLTAYHHLWEPGETPWVSLNPRARRMPTYLTLQEAELRGALQAAIGLTVQYAGGRRTRVHLAPRDALPDHWRPTPSLGSDAGKGSHDLCLNISPALASQLRASAERQFPLADNVLNVILLDLYLEDL